MSSLTEDARFVAGFASARSLPERRVALKCDISGQWHVLSAREWTVLQHALTAGGEVAVRSTDALQRALGVRELFDRFDALPPGLVARLLGISRRLRPCRDELPPVTSGEAGLLLERFVAAGLIVPLVRERLTLPAPSAPDVYVVTADQPPALERILGELTRDEDGAADGVVIRVCDSSELEGVQGQNRDLCEQLSNARVRIQYLGEAARARLYDQLVARGIERRTARFALRGCNHQRIGAGRNLAVLSSAGRRIVLLADDVVPRVWLRGVAPSAVKLTNGASPHALAFARTRAGLFEGMSRQPEPVWRAHGALLGAGVAATMQSHDLLGGCPLSPLAPSWGTLLRGRIRTTVNGIIGGSGTGWLRLLLALEAPADGDPLSNRAIYAETCAHAYRRVSSTDITLAPRGAGGIAGIGLDGRDIIPPFTPSLGSEDLLFFGALKRLDPTGVAAYPPQTIEQWPLEGRRDHRVPIWADTGIRTINLLSSIVERRCDGLHFATPDEALAKMGQALRSVGASGRNELRNLLREVWLSHASHWLEVTERALASRAGEPEWWADDVNRFRAKLISEARCVDAILPRDSSDVNRAVEDNLLALLSDLGRLYEAWPEIWSVAQESVVIA